MRFRYLRDPLFRLCVVAYFVNRWVLKTVFADGFCHDYLNDLLCIPFWVPIMLWGMRKIGLRRDDAPPRAQEILVPLVLWSFVFELVVPRLPPFQGLAFCDHVDILCYTLGAAVAAGFWRVWYRPHPRRLAP
jgi:hypothetical protein